MQSSSGTMLQKRSSSPWVLLATGIGFLLLTITLISVVVDKGGWEYYKHVDEVLSSAPSWRNKRMQVHGFVTPGSVHKTFDSQKQRLRYDFQIENCGHRLQVTLLGVVPDTFQDGAEVVIRGKLLEEFVPSLQATEVIAKCPSKYEQSPQQQTERAQRCTHDSSSKKTSLQPSSSPGTP